MNKNYIDRIKLFSKLYFLLLCVLLNYYYIYADFEQRQVGARASVLGGYTTISDDVYGLYYNPGVLAFMKYPEFAVEYARVNLGLSDNSNITEGIFGYACPIKNNFGTIGLSWYNFSLVGYYTENNLSFSYSKKIVNSFSFGLTLKPMYQSYTVDDYGITDPVFDYGKRTTKLVLSIDQGILWNFYYPDYFLGFSILNINQPDIGLSQTEQLPMKINFGISYRHNYEYNNPFNICFNSTYYDNKFDIYAGVEKWTKNKALAFRLGLGFSSKQSYSISFGLGVGFKSTEIDYSACIPLTGIVSNYGTHRLSLLNKYIPDEIIMRQNISPDEYIKERDSLKKQINELATKLEETENKLALTSPEITEKSKEIETLKQQIYELKTKLNDTESKLKLTQNELERIKSTPSATNTPVVKPVEQTPKPTIERPSVRTHVVQKGETLLSIALKYYGNESKVKDIYNANKDKIERGQVVPGQVLIIP